MFRDPIRKRGVLGAFRRAAALEPRSAEAQHQLGLGFLALHHLDSARAASLRALELEPGRLITFRNLAQVELYARDPDEARRWADSAIAADPAHFDAYRVRGIVTAMAGNTPDASRNLALFERLADATPGTARCTVAMLARAADVRDACAGMLAAARFSGDSAQAFLGLGDTARMYEALERSLEPRRGAVLPWLWGILQEPIWDEVRRIPRFQRILDRLRPDPEDR